MEAKTGVNYLLGNCVNLVVIEFEAIFTPSPHEGAEQSGEFADWFKQLSKEMYLQGMPLSIIAYSDKPGSSGEDLEKKAFIDDVLKRNGIHFETVVARGQQ